MNCTTKYFLLYSGLIKPVIKQSLRTAEAEYTPPFLLARSFDNGYWMEKVRDVETWSLENAKAWFLQNDLLAVLISQKLMSVCHTLTLLNVWQECSEALTAQCCAHEQLIAVCLQLPGSQNPGSLKEHSLCRELGAACSRHTRAWSWHLPYVFFSPAPLCCLQGFPMDTIPTPFVGGTGSQTGDIPTGSKVWVFLSGRGFTQNNRDLILYESS